MTSGYVLASGHLKKYKTRKMQSDEIGHLQPAVQQEILTMCKSNYHCVTEMSASKSSKAREQGNAYYKQKKFIHAQFFYDEAIRHAALNEEASALAHGNRSALLKQCKDFSACARECRRALAHRSDKLTEQWRQKIKERLQSVENHNNHDVKDNSIDLLFGHAHAQLPTTSDVVQLAYTASKGRHWLAIKDIPAGSLITVGSAYAQILADVSTSYCHYCAKRLPKDVLFCVKCASPLVRFCDENCRDNCTRDFHRYECAWIEQLYRHLPPRTILLYHMATRCIVRSTKEQIVACDPTKLRSELVGKFGLDEGETYDNDLRSIAYLTGEFDATNQNIADIIIPVFKHYLTKCDYFKRMPVAEKVYSSLMRTICGRLNKNSYETGPFLPELEYDPNQESPMSVYHNLVWQNCNRKAMGVGAVGVFPVQSLINHSCIPNLCHYFNGQNGYFRTIYDVKKGEELTASYGRSFLATSRERRQEYLKERFEFDCDCMACSDPTLQRLEQAAFDGYRCYSCQSLALKNQELLHCTNNCTEPSQLYKDVKKKADDLRSNLSCRTNDDIIGRIAALRTIYAPENKLLFDTCVHAAKILIEREQFSPALHMYRNAIIAIRDTFNNYNRTLLEEHIYKFVFVLSQIDSVQLEDNRDLLSFYSQLASMLYGQLGIARVVSVRDGERVPATISWPIQ